jgi:ankyrin repeat protein
MIKNSKNNELLIAVKTKNIDMVKKLLDEGADINNKDGWSPLLIASMLSNKESSIEVVKLLLDRGANINIKNNNASTPLMVASKFSNSTSSFETVKLLLDRGADINIKSNDGWTPLIVATRYSNTSSSRETVKLLLDRGSDINAKNNDGSTSLIMSIKYNESSNETVELLLDRGADPFIKNKTKTAFDFCHTDECRDLISKYIWKYLYKRDVDTAKRYGKSVLSKDIWELILLNKRQQQLCSKLNSNKNREVLKYFALELNIPTTDNMTKPKLCGLISRHLGYGKYYSEASKKYTEKKINEDIKNVKDMASRFGLDRNKPIGELLKDLSLILE